MSTSAQRRLAEHLYHSGLALFQRGLYTEALIELRRAEDAFRVWDARGHPFSHHISNGISGLANSLALSGQCHQELGNFRAALTSYETSLINSKFEKRKAFRAFTQNLYKQMTVCYEKLLESSGDKDREAVVLGRDPEIDISFRFPYSLPPEAVPFARLYEIAPDRYSRYRDYYQRVKETDREIRRSTRTSDESTMTRISIYVWSILAAIWVIYGLIVIEAQFRNK